ncbi:AAA family ATPase [Hymenobacter yonginensis]|uniref:AAA family ATPase n=1 Tax=Hymenobacter yonginensis TaxID=748197 RepID=A0ABY7PTQ2_9BACT|nr:AAA family ATPase [Hymenobacter yonginensis]WBO86282.1 AAA family ATPase [Hymenobacter yonginensis]
MKFLIQKLTVYFRDGQEVIDFDQISYFYGRMGAGKSSIVRLIDYCLGGKFILTPALQRDFVGAALLIQLEDCKLSIDRTWLSEFARVEWQSAEDDIVYNANISIRNPMGEIIAETGVETLSDLIFYLSKRKIPKVRVSKTSDKAELSRLSLRDMLWYCYLDQDNIDSNFFHLEGSSSPFFKKNKSMDVLRFILGFQNEVVANLEDDLNKIRTERTQYETYYKGLADVLLETETGSSLEIQNQINKLKIELTKIETEIKEQKEILKEKNTSNAAKELQNICRNISIEINNIDNTLHELSISIDNDTRHLNEISGLSLKFQRATSARAILNGVEFESCPRCTQELPTRDYNCCKVCGQLEDNTQESSNFEIVKSDVFTRIKELNDIIKIQNTNFTNLTNKRKTIIINQNQAEMALNEAMKEYDSAYLSNIIQRQKKIGSIEQKMKNLNRLLLIAKKSDFYQIQVSRLKIREKEIREDLQEAKDRAEGNDKNIRRLQQYFKDCLIRANFPGIQKSSLVVISPKTFIPTVYSGDTSKGEKPTETTFLNVSSGGKKTIFKACFAIAVHRLALELKAILPNILIVDSPMKNISERENQDVFEGFYNMIYSLASDKMKETQFVMVDKELFLPKAEFNLLVKVRHMTPNEDANPPLRRSYRGL